MAADPNEAPDPTVLLLGARVRLLREQHGMTLEQLADAAGVSRAMLSKVERGEKSPTLTIVSRIAKGFNMSLSLLLGDTPEAGPLAVVRKNERIVFHDEDGVERHVLSPSGLSNGIELVLHIIPPHTTLGTLLRYSTKASKYVVVQEGTLTVLVGETSVNLEVGDAMYFEIRAPYRFVNNGDVRCSYYVVIAASR